MKAYVDEVISYFFDDVIKRTNIIVNNLVYTDVSSS
jgi:hypothetical protein